MAIEFGSIQAKRIAQRDKLIDSPAWDELKAIYQEMAELRDEIKAAESRLQDLEHKARDVRREYEITADDELFFAPMRL